MSKNLLKEMTIEELELEMIKQKDNPKRIDIIQLELARRERGDN